MILTQLLFGPYSFPLNPIPIAASIDGQFVRNPTVVTKLRIFQNGQFSKFEKIQANRKTFQVRTCTWTGVARGINGLSERKLSRVSFQVMMLWVI